MRATGNDQYPVISIDTRHDRRNQMRSRRCVLLGAQLHRAGTASDLRAVPQRQQTEGCAGHAEEVQSIGHRIGVQCGQAF